MSVFNIIFVLPNLISMMRKTVLFMLLALIFTACSNEEVLRQVI